MRTISAAMVLYEEELLVDLAIKSIKDFVDEFVIVDNGCTDRTMEVVRDCIRTWGLNATTFKFDGTLRDARAYSFDRCATDWIFVQDGDHICQTEGPHSIGKIREWVNEDHNLTYSFPLVRLFYDYTRTVAKLPMQPPHKLLYRNIPKLWSPAGSGRNLPTSIARENRLQNFYGVWNITIKRPDRVYERQHWPQWRSANRPIPKRHWIARFRGFEPKDFNKVAEHWLTTKVFETNEHPPAEPEKYGGYPKVIQEEVDRGVIRNCYDTVETIRQKRKDAGLVPI